MWKPRVVVACVVERKGKFLIVEETVDDQTVFNQPSGHLEANETLVEAIKRETLEETGWIFEPTAILSITHLLNPDTNRIFIRFSFTGRLVKCIPNATIDPDISQIHWMSYEEIIKRNPNMWRTPLVIESLEAYRSGVRYPLDLVNTLQVETCQQNALLLDYLEA